MRGQIGGSQKQIIKQLETCQFRQEYNTHLHSLYCNNLCYSYVKRSVQWPEISKHNFTIVKQKNAGTNKLFQAQKGTFYNPISVLMYRQNTLIDIIYSIFSYVGILVAQKIKNNEVYIVLITS